MGEGKGDERRREELHAEVAVGKRGVGGTCREGDEEEGRRRGERGVRDGGEQEERTSRSTSRKGRRGRGGETKDKVMVQLELLVVVDAGAALVACAHIPLQITYIFLTTTICNYP
ncbi:hypothetical protein R3P38DRAFT_2811967 [Favolaschia claudopus]|uniref:Uncharacterized protein n=1 Tax=Favolaschia claudopus TaxID=2862362 RepID=A0AAV9Z7N5_9AGAR